MSTTVTLQPSAATGKDTYISQTNPTFNYGTSTTLATSSAASNLKYGYVQFDLSTIPANAHIISAVLTLTNIAFSGSPTTTFYRSTTAWFEGSQNGAAPSAGQDGSTWNLRNANGSVAWTAGAGGDRSGSIGTIPFGSFVGGGANNFDLTAEIQAIANGTVTNNGWVWQTSGSSDFTWGSSDHATSTSRPKLVVVYTANFVTASVAGTSTASAVLSTVNPSLSLQPDATNGVDTYLLNGAGAANNYGIFATLAASDDSGGGASVRKGLIKFDLSALPAGAIIQSAKLVLKATSEADATVHPTINIHRSLVQWYEGTKSAAAPGAGENASTWNNRNTNGSINWTGGAGGVAGTEYATTPTDSQVISGLGAYYWDVAADVRNIAAGLAANFGWWLINTSTTVNNNKIFDSSDSVTAANRPILMISYQPGSAAAVAGTSTVTGRLTGIGKARGVTAGIATTFAQLITNFFSVGHIAGTSTVTGTVVGIGKLKGNSFGDSTAIAHIIASSHSVGSSAGTSAHVAHLKGVFRMRGLAAGIGSLVARLSSEGQMRAATAGSSTAIATGYARAVNVAAIIGCNPVPLFFVTDGSVKTNGQLNILNFLSERNGYLLKNYKPQIPQYKDGGNFSASPQSQGRRLRNRVFDNVIDVLEVSAKSSDQDALIQYQQDLLAFQEAAADYWTAQYPLLPYYMVARAARETNTRYAIIHMMSCPELENPFDQPFFDHNSATIGSLTIRIEHGPWLSTPPGKFECVSISSQREWTVSGWQVGT